MFTDIGALYDTCLREKFTLLNMLHHCPEAKENHVPGEEVAEFQQQEDGSIRFPKTGIIVAPKEISLNSELIKAIIEKFDYYRTQGYDIKGASREAIYSLTENRKIHAKDLILFEGPEDTLLNSYHHTEQLARMIADYKGYQLFQDYLQYKIDNHLEKVFPDDHSQVNFFLKTKGMASWKGNDRIECTADKPTIQKYFNQLVKHEVLDQESVAHILDYAFSIFEQKVIARKFTPAGNVKDGELMKFVQEFYAKYCFKKQQGANQWIELILMDCFTNFDNPEKTREQIRENIKDNWSKEPTNYRFRNNFFLT